MMDYIQRHFHEVERHGSLNWAGVVAAVERGECKAVLLKHNGERRGFLIYSIRPPALHIHAIYVERNIPSKVLVSALKWAQGQAREAGCKSVVGETCRKGWTRRFERMGFEHKISYLMELPV